MAITHRKGAYANFVPTKMAPAELAVVISGDPGTTDGKSVYVAFAAGDVKQLATMEDMHAQVQNDIIEQTQDIVDEIVAGVEDDVERAEQAAATFETDTTLSVSGKAADAKTVGDVLADLSAYTFSDPNNDGNIVITEGSGS